MNALTLVLAAGALVSGPAVDSPPQRRSPANVFPSGSVTVGYQQVNEGVRDTGRVFLGKLSCEPKGCQLLTASFLNCLPTELARTTRNATQVALDQTSTYDGSLRASVTYTDDRAVVSAEEVVSGALIRYRFTLRVDSEREITDLLDFSGAAVKDSPLLKKAVAWTLTPLIGTYAQLPGACVIALPGVGK